MFNIYTVVTKRNRDFWTALCLDTETVAEGSNQEEAINNLTAMLKTLEQSSDFRSETYSVADWRIQMYNFLIEGRKFPTNEVFELRLICL